jgi:uncharacterized protein (TIGR02147 family)
MKPITSYSDFRAYLGDWVDERKTAGLPGSNRWFAQKMGINSTSWLTSVLKGAKGLSKQSANKLSSILKHSPLESRYFETLVAFNLAHSLDERNRYYNELSGLKKIKDVKQVTASQYDLYAAWHHSAIRSLIGMYRFMDTVADYERIAALVSPPITMSQARKSVTLLVDLNLVKKTDDGAFELTSTAITSGENIRSLAIANFQRETMRLAQEALDRYGRDDRYIGTVTAGVSEKTFQNIRQLLIDTGNKIAEMAGADADADRVYQINLQAFPMSKPGKAPL